MSATAPQKDYGQPIGDRLLVRPMEKEQKKGTIFIPETAQEKSSIGVVVAAGDGRRTEHGLIPLSVQAGDRVLFSKYAGSEIEIHGESLIIMREDEVLLRLVTGA